MNALLPGTTLAMTLALCRVAQARSRAYGRATCARTTLAIALGTCAIVWALSLRLGVAISWCGAAMLACAGICAATDVQCGYIFDRVLLCAVAVVVPAAAVTGRLIDGLLGAFACGAALAIPFALTRGRAIGLGDVKFAGTAGLALGLFTSLGALWVACVSGGAFAAIALVTGCARRGTEVRFGPFLAFGVCIALLEGGR